MPHTASAGDLEFRDRFESGEFPPQQFDHRAHVRLAYVYLVLNDTDGAYAAMRTALLRFLERQGIDASKYHDTITRAWVMAVRHFMATSDAADSADAFIELNPELLDTRIMLSHYSAEVLFSPAAREHFVPPDREGIPRYKD